MTLGIISELVLLLLELLNFEQILFLEFQLLILQLIEVLER